jgi:hypothetical protein
MQALLGSRPRVTMELQWEAVFSMWSAPTLYHASYQLRVPNEIQLEYSELECSDSSRQYSYS